MFVRSAALAGSWYPGDARGLAAEVERCLATAEKTYGAPIPRGEPLAAAAPHAGLAYSGPLAAAAYALLRAAPRAIDVFVVFGACHRMRLSEPAVWTAGEWDTPLGAIAVDEELARLLVENGVGGDFARAHLGDNSIEMQTPFIRHLFPDAMIVPIAMSPFADSWRHGERAARLAEECGRRAVAVASTDLTHYGAAFGVMPAGRGEGALRWTRENDERFLEPLLAMSLDRIVSTAERDGSACGSGAAAAAAGWARERGCARGRLLGYANSHEIMPRGEAEHIVGYASVVFEKGV